MGKRGKLVTLYLPHVGVKHPKVTEAGYREQQALRACGCMNSTTQKYSNLLVLLSFCQILLNLIIKE